ncbi:hypothetical protein GOV09_00670 [Candidatus Woesearchaeota archaeon]|nr:hypothetical protein [Candidatus Woesearchaeota archaeon]
MVKKVKQLKGMGKKFIVHMWYLAILFIVFAFIAFNYESPLAFAIGGGILGWAVLFLFVAIFLSKKK